ncbi:MAG TPA: transposase, partial [Steroidobacteraceae bacterium]
MEHIEAHGIFSAASEQAGPRAQRAGDQALEVEEVARPKKIAARQRRIIVFIDESGLSERPCRARTWAPKGETPVLQYAFGWKHLSVIAGASFLRFYFRFFAGSIKAPQIVEFLRALKATIGRRLLIVWDGLRAHRSRLVRQYVESQRGAIALEFLPPY